MAFRGIPFYVKPDGKTLQLPTLVAQEVPRFRKNLNAVHARRLLDLKNAAQKYFREDIKRPAESGEGKGGRRETSNFTFGTKAGGAFVGNIFQEGNLYGFGYPNIARADAATHFVWRSLEHGLRGTGGTPGGRGNAMANVQVTDTEPQGRHLMPRGYFFTTRDPSTSVLRLARTGGAAPTQWNRMRLGGKKGRASREGAKRENYGKGIEGKRFIERAWFEVGKTRINQGYRQMLRKSIRVFK